MDLRDHYAKLRDSSGLANLDFLNESEKPKQLVAMSDVLHESKRLILLGFTQSDVARHCGVWASQISRHLANKGTNWAAWRQSVQDEALKEAGHDRA